MAEFKVTAEDTPLQFNDEGQAVSEGESAQQGPTDIAFNKEGEAVDPGQQEPADQPVDTPPTDTPVSYTHLTLPTILLV